MLISLVKSFYESDVYSDRLYSIDISINRACDGVSFSSEKIGGAVVAVFLAGVTSATIAVSVVLELPSTIVSMAEL